MTETVTYEFTDTVMADNRAGQRVKIPKGTRVSVDVEREKIIDRTGIVPVEVETKRLVAVASDHDIALGCLTACIRTRQAVSVVETPKPMPPKVEDVPTVKPAAKEPPPAPKKPAPTTHEATATRPFPEKK